MSSLLYGERIKGEFEFLVFQSLPHTFVHEFWVLSSSHHSLFFAGGVCLQYLAGYHSLFLHG